jgi:hypothetical protein
MTNLVDSARRLRGLTSLRSTPQPYCQVCFGPETRLQVVHDRHSDRKLAVRICPRCGYVEVPENLLDDDAVPISLPSASARREREMSKLGVEVLGRRDASVLALGEQPELLHGQPDSDRKYDVVVAADVIDRFEDPLVDFAAVLQLVGDDGVLICSSTIHDGGSLARRRQLFGRGRGSYFTPQSLRRIAAVHHMRIDFRLPPPSSRSSARRRYVIFSRSPAVMAAVTDYFGRNQHAPTNRGRVRRRRAEGRPQRGREADRAGRSPSALA